MLPLRDNIPTQRTPVVTRTLIFINALAFIFELMLSESSLEQFMYLFGIVPARFTHPEWAAQVGFPGGDYMPLLTHMFLHGGWMHILSNMWTLWIFGDNVEDRMGSWRFLIFYLFCGVAAGVTHMLINPASTIPSVGASGAIAGVLAAYFLWFMHSRVLVLIPIIIFPIFAEVPAVLYLGVWFITQLFSGTASLVRPQEGGGIAFWAHIGGFIAGALLCWLFLRPRDDRAPIEREMENFEPSWAPRWRER
ncbi:MAG: rhomboid family intramembrane serine protease [Verrucomicrobiaceae bacterium]|nr:rhomboid family intramembrane serine protease [Verrucomicrobiaceae bacterium]